MSATDDAIQITADAFCEIGDPQYRDIYMVGLKQIAMTAEAELINRMQLSYAQMSIPLDYKKH